MPRLIALDGESLSNSFLMYAAPPDHEPAPREALRTFVERWVRLFRESPPSHAAFVTDGRAEEEPDPALSFVRARARAVAEALGIPVVSRDGHPAAHVIFATARRAREQHYDVIIASSSEELLPILAVEGCQYVNLALDCGFSPEEVIKRRGVSPAQVPDLRTLMVTFRNSRTLKAGSRTWVELLNQMGSLDELLRRTSELPESPLKTALRRNKKKLLALRRESASTAEAHLAIEPDALVRRSHDEAAARNTFESLGLPASWAALRASESLLDIDDQYWVVAAPKDAARRKMTPRSGKWLVFVSPNGLDALWQRIKAATEAGLLGSGAKASTGRSNPNAKDSSKVIVVYTYDADDEADVRRVRQALRELGVTQKIPYKEDRQTLLGVYRTTGHTRVSRYFE